jgi:hypothetical protein
MLSANRGATSGRRIVMQRIRILFPAAGFLVLAAFSSAIAETGPCLPAQDGSLLCGQGVGAAQVVDGTISPSKRFAFAWRAPGGSPTEIPDGPVESLLIRLSDGAILWKTKGEYWRAAGREANHIDEGAAWSPNSRFAAQVTDSKWDTDYLRFYAIGTDDQALVLDLKAVVEPAVRKQLRQLVKNEGTYTFSILSDSENTRLTIDNRGLVKAQVLMQIPKQDRDVVFDVTLLVSQKGGALAARDVSVRRSRGKPQ